MMFLSAAQADVPMEKDPIALAIVLCILVIFAITVIRKNILSKKKAKALAVPVAEAPVEKPTAPGTAGTLKLHNVDPKTAAMLMAITADKMGKPINELRFISIKEVN